MDELVLMAFIATCGTWLITALGAATVIFFKSPELKILNLFLGFASGVMIAASFWSLLQPAIERADMLQGLPSYIIVTLGFLSGAFFMWLSDKIISLLINKSKNKMDNSKESLNRIIMLILSITLHNIPEGLAVGVAFGAIKNLGCNPEGILGAVTIAVGIGLQNFPEGAAVSIPLRRDGYSRKRSFFYGQLSGMVEPVFGVIGALLVVYIEKLLPFALSFAAGAMILVAVHELIPECQQNRKSQPYFATMGIIFGFSAMMLLDVMLG